jgi:preprotein translocase subunit Sss1
LKHKGKEIKGLFKKIKGGCLSLTRRPSKDDYIDTASGK